MVEGWRLSGISSSDECLAATVGLVAYRYFAAGGLILLLNDILIRLAHHSRGASASNFSISWTVNMGSSSDDSWTNVEGRKLDRTVAHSTLVVPAMLILLQQGPAAVQDAL